MSDAFRDAVVEQMPALRAFAAVRADSHADADDLFQETLSRALRYQASYEPGTNIKSWLFKILDNCYKRTLSKGRNTVEDIEGQWAARQVTNPSQDWKVEFSDVMVALRRLNPDARNALMLVGANGYSYQEAAHFSRCSVGTVKSRVNRARERLAELTGQPNHTPRPQPQAFTEQSLQMAAQRSQLLLTETDWTAI